MQELVIYGPLINAGIGFVFGLTLVILGFVKSNKKHGIYGFLACFVGGAVLGLFLSVPALIFFAWLILRTKPDNANQ